MDPIEEESISLSGKYTDIQRMVGYKTEFLPPL